MSWWLITIIVIVAIVVLFFVLSTIFEKQKQKNAPLKLKKALEEFDKGELNACLKTLSDAFYAPSSSKYTAEDAKIAFEVVALFEKVLIGMNMEAETLTKNLKEALSNASANGGTVSESFTKPVEDFLEKAESDTNLYDKLKSDIENGNIEVIEKDTYPETELSDNENAIINSIGKSLVFGKTDKAIELASSNMNTTNNDFKADLLNQRGTCYFMQKKYDMAKSDYSAAAAIQPERAVHYINIAEVCEKLKLKEQVVENAQKALSLTSIAKDDKKKAEKLIKKYS